MKNLLIIICLAIALVGCTPNKAETTYTVTYGIGKDTNGEMIIEHAQVEKKENGISIGITSPVTYTIGQDIPDQTLEQKNTVFAEKYLKIQANK